MSGPLIPQSEIDGGIVTLADPTSDAGTAVEERGAASDSATVP
jgi:hypothetical protein